MMQTEREYAEAMFSLCAESGESEKYLEALIEVRALLRENPEYTEFLASPAIPIAERCQAIDEAFGKYPEYVASFLKILCENSHVKGTAACIDEFERLVNSARNRAEAKVYSALELKVEQKQRLESKLASVTGKEIDAVYIVDKSLIGGIRVELEGVTYDGSVKHRLDEVKEVITK